MRGALLACTAALAAAAALPAQIRVALPYETGPNPRAAVVAEVHPFPASVRPGGHGHVRIELHNGEAVPHRVGIELHDPYFGRFRATAQVEIEGGGAARVFLPLVPVQSRLRLELWSDRGERAVAGDFEAPGDEVGVSALLCADPGADRVGFEAMLGRLLAKFPSATSHRGNPNVVAALDEIRPADLPPSWTGISGYDLVIVDAVRGGLDEGAQRVLRDYLRAGGRLLALGADTLPAGPLRAALDGAAPARGFGTALALDADAAAGLPGAPAAVARLEPWLTEGDGFLRAGLRATSGPLPPESYRPAVVPGVGQPPLRLFFVLILVFGIFVGPVNYLYWKRRRRLPMLLVTVPGLGLLTTVLLLGYGFLSEGLGIRSAERTLTILDQDAHTAVAWQTRTLFAGLSPDRLRPRPGTFVSCLEPVGASWTRIAHVLEIRDDGTIDGALLPSRTLTTLGVVSQGPERARLRFQRAPEGFVPLAGPELRPRPRAGAVVLRTPDGAHWIAGADGVLRACAEVEAAEARDAMVAEFLDGGEVRAEWRWNPPLPLDASWPHEGPVARFLQAMGDGAALPPGAYVALVEDSPAVDRLGLRGDAAGVHLVLGRLGPEDLVD